MAHANGFLPQTYQKALEPLLPHYHAISIFSKPSWAETHPERLKHWSQLADDMVKGLKERGVSKIVGIGHSLGGVLTLYAAVQHPELFSHVILIDPTMLSPKLIWQIRLMKFFGLEARRWLVHGALRRKREWGSVEEAYQYFRGRQLFKAWSDEMVEAYTKSITASSPQGGVYLAYPPEWEAQIYRTIPTDVWKFAKQLRQPTLVIRGENSNTFTANGEKAFRRANPTAVFKVVGGAGHLVVQEKPEEVSRMLKEFLEPQV